jgi:hypothetical protein
MTKLKPCPFCGSEVDLSCFNGTFYVYCAKCDYDLHFNEALSRDAVLNLWNTRTDPPTKFLRGVLNEAEERKG